MKRRERRNGGRLLGLTLSDAGVQSLIAAGAEADRGILEDPESLRSGAAPSDGVIHCAFDHSAFGNDFSKFLAVCEKDRCAIEALGDALNGLLLDLPRPPTCVWSSLKPWWMKRLKTSEWGPVRAYVEKPGVRVAHCQPKNRGTAPPILYSLLSIQQINDDAIVALFNSALQSALTLSALGRLCVDQAVQSRPLVPPIDLGGQV